MPSRLHTWLIGASALACAANAWALDKQGSAHGGEVGGNDDGFDISGGVTLGVSLINPTYAARPDNTGLALFRYALHADIDLIGRKLSIPLDLNTFTDRERKGAAKLAPTEFDVITGLTTTWAIAKGADLELGSRVEHDRPVDRGGFTQTYIDARSRLLYSLAKIWPSLGRDLVDGDIAGYATLGWFAFNPTYAARPDNTGLALLRYVAHTELSVWHDHWSVGLDGTFFTDRHESPVAPTELDLTYEAIGRLDPWEVHVAYERDMPIDRSGLVQSFLYMLIVYDFDLQKDVLQPLESRGAISSP